MARLSNYQLRKLLQELEDEEAEILGRMRKKKGKMRRATEEEMLKEAVKVKKEEDGNGTNAGYRIPTFDR